MLKEAVFFAVPISMATIECSVRETNQSVVQIKMMSATLHVWTGARHGRTTHSCLFCLKTVYRFLSFEYKTAFRIPTFYVEENGTVGVSHLHVDSIVSRSLCCQFSHFASSLFSDSSNRHFGAAAVQQMKLVCPACERLKLTIWWRCSVCHPDSCAWVWTFTIW